LDRRNVQPGARRYDFATLMYILGINCVYHESSACLIRSGALVCAAEEERFNRHKHGKQARADNPDELPVNAIRFCLDHAGIATADVPHVAVAGDPTLMQYVRRAGLPSAWHRKADQALFLSKLPDVESAVRALGFRGRFHWVPHHLAHAASAFYPSRFADAAVLVVDALGDDAYSTRWYAGRDNRLSPLGNVTYPSSLGYLWELVSVYLGFDVYDAAKVMGLAAFGDPARFAPQFAELAWTTPDGGFATNDRLTQFSRISYYPPAAWLLGLEQLFGVRRRAPGESLSSDHYDVAAGVQAITNDLVLHMVHHLHRAARSDNLCLAGGVALNCVTNRRAFEDGPFRTLFVQPAANDAGLALGAADWVWHEFLDNDGRSPMEHAYWGPAFSDDKMRLALKRRHVVFERSPEPERAVAAWLAEQKIVAVFHGSMELGPRALGNRSILADPRQPDMREHLNRKVKHREFFRPLAASVLAEHASEWFEIGKPTSASDFMLMAYPATPSVRSRIPAVLHRDGTSRIQTVHAGTNERFHRIISEFHRLTGVPLVLNTSYNDQEPIVCTPDNAIDTFVQTEIDMLAMGPYLAFNAGNARP
jgi:carbamoyltransferase